MAHLVRSFAISFAPQDDGDRFLREWKDHFNVSLAPLHLQFTELPGRGGLAEG